MLIFDKLNKLIINLETTDYFEIDGKYIKRISFDKITKTVARTAVNAYCISDYARHITLEIDKAAKNIKSAFGATLFDRLLNARDIVSFELYFPIENQNELHKEHIFAPWDDEEDYYNNYQIAFLKPDDLYIHIQEAK